MLYLFNGAAQTNKLNEAKNIASQLGHSVQHIDLSRVISKYIGETEKNLATLFIKAENKKWILFFDEADALFGKRSNVQDSHDRHENQDTNILLRYIERYPGLVILSTNIKSNLDDSYKLYFSRISQFNA